MVYFSVIRVTLFTWADVMFCSMLKPVADKDRRGLIFTVFEMIALRLIAV